MLQLVQDFCHRLLRHVLPFQEIAVSELEDYVHRQLELVLAGSVVVRRAIEGVVEPDFGAKQNRASHPVSPHQSLLGVAVLVAGSLAFYVIQEVGTNREVVLCVELPFDVIDHGPFGREASNFTRGTERTVRAFFRRGRTEDGGHAADEYRGHDRSIHDLAAGIVASSNCGVPNS